MDVGRSVCAASDQRSLAGRSSCWELRPGDSRRSDAHAAGRRACLHAHARSVTVGPGSDVVTIATDEAVAFAADLPHRDVNDGSDPVVFTLAVYDPAA